jgi:hypothetical protein
VRKAQEVIQKRIFQLEETLPLDFFPSKFFHILMNTYSIESQSFMGIGEQKYFWLFGTAPPTPNSHYYQPQQITAHTQTMSKHHLLLLWTAVSPLLAGQTMETDGSALSTLKDVAVDGSCARATLLALLSSC